MDAARQLAQLGEARAELVDRLGQHRLEALVGAARPRRRAELSRSLSATSRDCAPSWRSRSRRRRSASPASTIRARDARSSARLARSSASSSDRWVRSRPARKANGHQQGRDERRPQRRVARARPGHGHEQEGEQGEDVDRRELEALDGRRPPPAPHRPREHDGEEDEVAQGAQAGEHRRHVGVAADQQQVGRAVVAAERRAGRRTAARARRPAGRRRSRRWRACGPARWSGGPSGSSAPRCRKMAPHRPPSDQPDGVDQARVRRLSVNRNHAKPSRIMSAPIRLSGRRRHAYRPVPMKLQPTAGPKTAHTALRSWWSLASSSAITTPPAGERGEDDGDEKRPGRDDGRHRVPSMSADREPRRSAPVHSWRVLPERDFDGSEPARPEPVTRLAGARADSLVARTGHLASGTLACPRCDAPVALGAGPAAPADPLGCPYCEHTATRARLPLARRPHAPGARRGARRPLLSRARRASAPRRRGARSPAGWRPGAPAAGRARGRSGRRPGAGSGGSPSCRPTCAPAPWWRGRARRGACRA